MSCSFAGNSDIYGIGIRIGYYTQAVAVWFSNFFLLREAKSLRASNNLFLFALVVAGLIYTHDAHQTHAIEAFLLLQIGLCMAVVSILQSTRYSTRYMKLSNERLILRNLVFTTGMAFNIAFWWHGLDVMLPTPCQDIGPTKTNILIQQRRGTFVVYLVRTNIYGWIRTLMKTLSLLQLLWATLCTTLHDIEKAIHAYRMKNTRAAFIRTASVMVLADLLKNVGMNNENDNNLKHLSSSRDGEPEGNRSCSSRQSNLADGLPETQYKISQHRWNDTDPQQVALNTGCSALSANTEPSVLQLSHSRPYIECSFEKVREAEEYMDSVLSIYKTIVPVKKKLLGINFSVSTSTSQSNPSALPYMRCLYNTLRTTWTNKPPSAVRATLSRYITASQQHTSIRWPRLVNQMIELQRTHSPPPWRLLSLASDIRLSQIPRTISAHIWTFMAAETLLTIVIMIVQIELTISWNHIQGLQRLNTLGQLIPFILGVGGLVQVLWGKSKEIMSGQKEIMNEELGEYEVAMQTYIKWRNDEAGKVNSGVP